MQLRRFILTLVIGLTASRSADAARVVVMKLEGSGARKLERPIREIFAAEHELMSPALYREAALDLDATEKSGQDVATVCREIGCDAVVTGELRSTGRGYILEMRLLDGSTGRIKKQLLLRLKRLRLTDRIAEGLRERLDPTGLERTSDSDEDSNQDFRESITDEVAGDTAAEKRAGKQDDSDSLVEEAPAAGGLGGSFDVAGYYDSRGNTDFALSAFVMMPAGFSYFGFVTLQNESKNTLVDQNSYFSQQHLFYAPSQSFPVDVTGHFEFMSGNDNDAIRLGARWRVTDTSFFKDAASKIRLTYGIGLYPLVFDYVKEKSYRSFIGHAYFIDIKPGRVFLSGFADHAMALVKGAPAGASTPPGMTTPAPAPAPGGNMMTAPAPSGGLKHMIVTEHQLGIRLFAGLHAVVEGRHNPYLERKKTGFGFGLQYIVNFSTGN